MAQIFPRWTNKIPLMIGVGTPIVLCGVVFVIWYWFSPKYLEVGYEPDQPVPFSHKLHAGELGMDCRYCHNTVEVAARAAIPPADTCMNCHSQLNTRQVTGDAAPEHGRLQPVVDAYEGKSTLKWVRVHMLPDYAYFDHSVHVAAGVGCATCHGRVDQMETVFQQEPLSMSWCLNCHKDPVDNLRPQDQVTNMAWADEYDPAADPHRTRDVNPPIHCSGCHR